MRITALLLLALFAPALAWAQDATPSAPRITEVPVVLGTQTPLGEASITLPAGAALEDFEIAGDKVVVRQGPFHGEVPVSSTRLPEPPAPVIAPAAVAAAAATPQESDPAPPARANLAGPAIPAWLFPVLALAALAYGAYATACWLRLRRSHAALVAAREDEDD